MSPYRLPGRELVVRAEVARKPSHTAERREWWEIVRFAVVAFVAV